MEQLTINTDYTTENKKMAEEKYLLQINGIKLIDYINMGLILPDKHLGEECEKDIQSKNKDFLVVADGYLQELDEHQILLELILTDDEREKLTKIDEIHYFDFPLPITRIKKVYVQNTKIKKYMEANIKTSENGFLPKELFATYTKNNKPIFKRIPYNFLDEAIQPRNYEDKIRFFDKRMGMFSFVKNTELYYSSGTNQISNYSKHYFAILLDSLKVPLEEEQFKEIDTLLGSCESFKKLLYSNMQIDKEFINSEADKIENDEIRKIFLQLLKPTGTRETLNQLLEKKQVLYYLIGLVYNFRQKSANKKDNFKIDIEKFIPYEVAEISLAILGIYLGYKNIRSEEKIELEDKYFKRMFGSHFNMKFTFESKLDYITVETIYNICFKNKEHKGYEYDYLPYPIKKTQSLKIPRDTKFKMWYEFKEKQYFDIKHISIKKLSVIEVISGLLGKYQDEIIDNRQTKYLIAFIQYTFGDILTFNNKGQRYFQKSDLLEKIKMTEDKKIINELVDVLNIGKNQHVL